MKKYILIIGIFASSLISIIGFSQNISINTTGAANSSNSMLEVIQPAGAATGTIGLYINHPGTAGTIYGLQSIVNGTATTHYAGFFQATNATNNYAIIVPSGGGSVGIGTTTPAYLLEADGDIYANGGWFRVSGTNGIYWQSYGPGWYCQDGTWLRTYNNASIWANSGTIATNGSFSGGYGGTGGPAGGAIFAGNVGIGTTSPGYKLTVSGGAIGGNYGLLPNYAGWAAYGTGDGGAAIYNDNGSYQTLMLVGNNSGGGARQVSVWDYLTVNGNQTITGLAGTGDRLVMAHSNGQLFIGSINQGYGSNVQWIDGTTDISLSTKGVWTNITDMVITFTPVHSTVLAEFSCSGDVAGGYPLTEDVLIRFLVDGATVYAGGAVICEDDDNANYVSGWNIHCVRPIALSVGVSHTIQMQWYLQNTPEAKTVAIRAATGLGWAHRTLFIDD